MDFKKLANEEYNNEELSPHFGGKNGKPYWNINAPQCIYVPSFSFPIIIGEQRYRYTVTGSDGKEHTFDTDKPNAYLTPVWNDLPTGMVTIKVEWVDREGNAKYLSGIRNIFKMDQFPGRENLPKRACSYRECAKKALRWIFNEPKVQQWLVDRRPAPDFPLISYTSKIIGSVIGGMISYAKLEPENAEKAIEIAKIGGDFLIETSYGEEYALKGLPRTYMINDTDEKQECVPDEPIQRKNMIMMIYPAEAGINYIKLSKVTGDKKYFDAAMHIANFYKDTVLPNGSWPLLMSAKSGEKTSEKCCVAFVISNFLRMIGEETKEQIWFDIDKKYIEYITKTCHENYDWQAQFEDAPESDFYSNLTHIDADDMVMYIANNFAEDKEKLEEAEYLMRFIEDQFVVWGEFAPYIPENTPEGMYWYSPSATEQYHWCVPIDGSTAKIMKAFLELYKANKNPLILEKACALGDAVTRMQNPETGMIPTHWIFKDCWEKLDGWFWFNCHIGTANNMMYLADFLGEE